jgi:hypothetical protein
MWTRWWIVLCVAGCGGVPKELVKTETHNAFDNASSVAAHVKLKCGDQAASDEHCKQAADKLAQLCHALDELAKKAGAPGFDCAAWKELAP